MSFFLQLNTKEAIFLKMEMKQLTVTIDFHSRKENTMEVNGYR